MLWLLESLSLPVRPDFVVFDSNNLRGEPMASNELTSELLALSQILEGQAETPKDVVGGADLNFRVVCDELLAKIRDHIVKSRQGIQVVSAQPVASQVVSLLDVREFGYL